jgi:DNA-binding transcriptional LysR family regulator
MILARSTRHMALIQRRLAERLEPLGGVRFLPGPPLAPPIQVALWWHPSLDHDVGHAWFRNRLLEATAAMRE